MPRRAARFEVYEGRVPAEADLVCYWFAKAWKALQSRRAKSVGLVATNSIRGGANRKVLEPIAERNAIFEAWSDEAWTVDGAAVRVSLVCFGAYSFRSPHPEEPRSGVSKEEGGSAQAPTARAPSPFETAASPPPQGEGVLGAAMRKIRLDGRLVERVASDLSAHESELPKAGRLAENADVAFMGDTKGGAFDIEGKVARTWLADPLSANGRPNSDVLRHVEPRPAMWAALASNRSRHGRACPGHPRKQAVGARLKAAHASGSRLTRFIATARVAKHRLFVWSATAVCSDSQIIAIARDDDRPSASCIRAFTRRGRCGSARARRRQ